MKRILLILAIYVLASVGVQAQVVGEEPKILWEIDTIPFDAVSDFDISKNTSDFCAYENYGHVYILNSYSGDVFREILFEGSEKAVCLDFSPVDDFIAIATNKGFVYVYNVISGDELCKVNIESGPADVEFNNKGDYLIVGASHIFFIRTSDWSIEKKWLDLTYTDDYPPYNKPAVPLELHIRQDDKVIAGKFRGLSGYYFLDIEKMEIIKKVEGGSLKYFHKDNNFLIWHEKIIHKFNDEYFKIDSLKNNVYFEIFYNDTYLLFPLDNINKYQIYDMENRKIFKEFDGYANNYAVSYDNKYLLDNAKRMFDISSLTDVKEIEGEETFFEVSYSELVDKIIIKNNNVFSEVNIQIIDINGNIIADLYNGLFNSPILSFNTNQYTTGTYFITIQGKNINESHKLMIIK